MSKKLLKAVSPLAALSDGGIKGVMQNFSPMYNLVKKDEREESILGKTMNRTSPVAMATKKKGGKVTAKPKAKTAAKKGGRGDGIAQRGKTRGKFV